MTLIGRTIQTTIKQTCRFHGDDGLFCIFAEHEAPDSGDADMKQVTHQYIQQLRRERLKICIQYLAVSFPTLITVWWDIRHGNAGYFFC
jgi:hypothetical protein